MTNSKRPRHRFQKPAGNDHCDIATVRPGPTLGDVAYQSPKQALPRIGIVYGTRHVFHGRGALSFSEIDESQDLLGGLFEQNHVQQV